MILISDKKVSENKTEILTSEIFGKKCIQF